MKPIRLMVLADKGVVVAENKPNRTEGNAMFKKKLDVDPMIIEQDKKALREGKDGYTILMDSLVEKMGRVEKQIDLIPKEHQQDVINTIKLFHQVKGLADTMHAQMINSNKHDVVTRHVLDSFLTIFGLVLGEFTKGPSNLASASDMFFTMLTGATPDMAYNEVKRVFGDDHALLEGRKPDGKLH